MRLMVTRSPLAGESYRYLDSTQAAPVLVPCSWHHNVCVDPSIALACCLPEVRDLREGTGAEC
jgi:hypothetical protein